MIHLLLLFLLLVLFVFGVFHKVKNKLFLFGVTVFRVFIVFFTKKHVFFML